MLNTRCEKCGRILPIFCSRIGDTGQTRFYICEDCGVMYSSFKYWKSMTQSAWTQPTFFAKTGEEKS